MEHVLCLSVILLDGRFHGRADADRPEWPPSPWRLFQALLAGAHTGAGHCEWTDGHTKAFKWLEQRDPPLILAPKPHELGKYAISVPNNDMDVLAEAWARNKEPKKTAAELRTMKTVSPQCAADGQAMALHYLYPIAEREWSDHETQTVAETLCRIVRCLHTFGWGIDAAAACGRVLKAEEADRLSGVRWRPRPGPSSLPCRRRVPTCGSLQDLIDCHKQFIGRTEGRAYRLPKRPSVFDRVAYVPDAAILPRPFAVFELMRPDDADRRQALRQQDANVVAAMLRSLACRLARGDSHEFPNGSDVYVAGHKGNKEDRRPRFSYIVLPTIGHPNADGMIRRVMIAEPHGGDGTHAAWAASRLRGQVLKDNAGYAAAVLRTCDAQEKVVRRYMGPSRNWASVTPVVLPGYDDFKAIKPDRAAHATKAERLFLKAVEQAGLPIQAVTDVALRKAPVWPGSLHPRQYRRPDYLQHLPGWHARIAFREPVEGPLALGAGRHCGLGVLAAEDHGAP